jgi:GDP-L-fucose synthase
MKYFKDKKILITGGRGFLGKNVIRKLQDKECEIIVPRFYYDLTIEDDVRVLFKIHENIDIVIHLAADVGGIEYNRKNPGSVYYNNIMLNTLMMEYSRRNNVEKFVGIGSVCSYPKYANLPFKESDIWDGYPEETNAAYGLAKKMMMEQGIAYKKQYGFNSIHLLLINLYGKKDNFDLKDSHVIPGLIRKFVEAKINGLDEVIVWGNGLVSREFLNVEDAAEAIILATELYNDCYPVNIGSSEEIYIKELVNKISDIVEFKGTITWDKTKPNGQPRRKLDTSRALKEFNFRSSIDLDTGLKDTINWYIENYI